MRAHRAGIAIEIARLAEAVASQRAWLHAVIDQMPDAVMLADDKGRVTYNRAALALAKDEFESLDPFGNPKRIDVRVAAGAPCPTEDLPLVRALAYGEKITGKELRVLTSDGKMIPVAS